MRDVLNSIRFQLTRWYVVIFGFGAIIFSAYLYTELRVGFYKEFDDSLLRTAQAAATYFREFVEKGNTEAGAKETVKDVKLGEAAIFILAGHTVLAAAHDEQVWKIVAPLVASDEGSEPVFHTYGPSDLRVVHFPLKVGAAEYAVVAVEPMTGVHKRVAGVVRILSVGLPLMAFLAILGGLTLANRGLRPINTICDRAETITATNLDERLPVMNHRDELGRISTVVNALLGRLEDAFRTMRSFMMDASHELRTPLSVIQGEVDVVLSREREISEYKESLRIVRDQAKRMNLIVTDMLALSRADSGGSYAAAEDLYLNDLVEDCCRAAQSLAAKQKLELAFHFGAEDICVRGNEELLRRMVVNLIDNAIRYTPEGGRVDVSLLAKSGTAVLSVRDTGCGIAAEAHDRVFDRFYRVEQSRSRRTGGSGLGLSIVKLVAESHRGLVHLESQVGAGSTFTVELPTTA